MLNFRISLDKATIENVKEIYGNRSYETVETVLNDIVNRYFHNEYFDLKYQFEDTYWKCEICGEKSKSNKIIDTDGTNLEEHEVCSNCGNGYPQLL